MTTPSGEALIEAGARAACRADGYDPDQSSEPEIYEGHYPAWELYKDHSRACLLSFLSHLERRFPEIVAEIRKEIE